MNVGISALRVHESDSLSKERRHTRRGAGGWISPVGTGSIGAEWRAPESCVAT